MKIAITFKLTPESKDEMLLTYPKAYEEFREVMEMFKEKGGFGEVEKVSLRWLLESGRWE
jgi:hypothetical protein